MTKQQEKMAVLALDFIAQNNNAVNKNDLLKDMRLKNGDDNLARANRSIVYDKLTQELALVRLTGQSLISLTENGEVAQRIEYVPFGEVFVEERNNISNNPLRREKNGKR